MLSSLLIRGFRGCSEKHLELEISTGIIGTNGSGKTHILEALHIASSGYFAYLQSTRDEGSFFEILFTSEVWEKSFSIEREWGRDIYKVQWIKLSGKKYREQLPFRTVFVSPFDMNLFYFAPSMRREYIDGILARTFAQFTQVRRKYELIMRQRNALLKKVREWVASKNDLNFWDNAFCEIAITYNLYRRKWRGFVEEHMEIIHSFLPIYNLRFAYDCRFDKYEWTNSEEVLRRYFQENRDENILSGHTHIWPHLDDFSFFITKDEEEKQGNTYLSRWENKTLLLALKQIEILFIKKYLDLPIVLLFDDIFSELDEAHADIIITQFNGDQVIITSQRELPENEKWKNFSCINLENQ